MAVSKDYIDYILEQLHGLGGVTAVPILEGHGFFFDNKLFAIIAKDRFRMKMDETNLFLYKDAGLVAPPVLESTEDSGFFQVPDSIINTPLVFEKWCQTAIDIAS